MAEAVGSVAVVVKARWQLFEETKHTDIEIEGQRDKRIQLFREIYRNASSNFMLCLVWGSELFRDLSSQGALQ